MMWELMGEMLRLPFRIARVGVTGLQGLAGVGGRDRDDFRDRDDRDRIVTRRLGGAPRPGRMHLLDDAVAFGEGLANGLFDPLVGPRAAGTSGPPPPPLGPAPPPIGPASGRTFTRGPHEAEEDLALGWGPVKSTVAAPAPAAVNGPGSSGAARGGGPTSDPPTRPVAPRPEADRITPLAVPLAARGRLDPSVFVVIGDDIAAGMGEFALSEDSQKHSFPAVVARHMGVPFAQPLIEPPGIGGPISLSLIGVRAPRPFQTTVLRDFPPRGVPANLSVPGFTVSDALRRRPTAPLTQDDPRQSAANLILGLHASIYGKQPPTQLEAALRHRPSLVLVALGFTDLLRPALGAGEGAPTARAIVDDLAELVRKLTEQKAEVILATVPDPLDTAGFSTIDAARDLLRLDASFLGRAYGLSDRDRITPLGLFEIGCQVQRRAIGELRPEHVLKYEAAATLHALARSVNDAILELDAKKQAAVYDLADFYRRVRRDGISVGSTQFLGSYLGGFYSLNGLYPGRSGHAMIARDVLGFLNGRYGAAFPIVDVADVIGTDPVAHYGRAEGPEWTWEALGAKAPRRAVRRAATSESRPTSAPSGKATEDGETLRRLRLPPGREQVLPLNASLSYHGDGMRVVHCLGDEEAGYGLCGNALFGGLALFGSALNGSIHIRFLPPEGDVARFEIRFVEGALNGEDGVLSAPQLFRFPILDVRVTEWPSTPACTGALHLTTGEVSDLAFTCVYSNSGLAAIAGMNPSFPRQPIRFPGTYGAAKASFRQRPDGLLDFTFQGSTFIPLGQAMRGEPFRFPLPFGDASRRFASVPARGTALHPHLRLSTAATAPCRSEGEVPIPVDTVREFVVLTGQSSFGDAFTLNSPELGVAHGRSHVQGRIQVQFGERFGHAVPFHVTLLPPAGLLDAPSLSPLQDVFPARLSRGLSGHDEFLRFPLRTYYLDNVYLLEDPFDLALGAIDVRSGEVIGDLVHRGFIGQDTFFALVRVEPRTPQASFEFRGPASFRAGPGGQLLYTFDGRLTIPYPEGFLFPGPDLATGVPIGPDSKLDPFMEIVASHEPPRPAPTRSGHVDGVISSIGSRFSYAYSLCGDEGRPSRFSYVNEAQGAKFELTPGGLSALTVHRFAPGASPASETLTFSGFGTWSVGTHSSLHQATVQVSATPGEPYVSILVDGNLVSSVNTQTKVPGGRKAAQRKVS